VPDTRNLRTDTVCGGRFGAEPVVERMVMHAGLFTADVRGRSGRSLEKEIEPLLKRGVNIICDRYFLSSVAYGSIDTDMDWLIQINSRFLAPDLTIYLDVAAPVCVRRMRENGRSIELFEKQDVLEKVAANYKRAFDILKNEIEVAMVDGDRSSEEIAKDIIEFILNFKILTLNRFNNQ